MAVPVTKTKITIPLPRPDLLSRSRLLDLVDDILDYPLTLVSAPAGYGKTSFLIDLACQAEYPVTWFAIDSLDRDLIRFLYHLIAAINSTFPDFGSKTFSVIDNQGSTPIDLDQIIRVLVNDIYDNITEHFVIILDDYHQVADFDQVTEFINRFSQAVDDNCHLVLSSRTIFNMTDLPLLVGRSEVLGINFEDLAFKADELKALLEKKYQQTISDQESNTLIEETEGWITGLLLSFETNSLEIPVQSKAADVSGVNLFNYLAQQVFESQPNEIQEFLLKSSFLDEFNADAYIHSFCEESERNNIKKIITQVQSNNLFVQPLETDRTWFRYHQLFKEFLQAYYTTNYPEETKNLLSHLLVVFIDDKDWEKAYSVAVKTADPTTIGSLIDRASSALFHSGRVDLLSKWLDVLPESGFKEFPRLYAVQGITKTLLGNPNEGLNLLEKALLNINIQQDPNILGRTLICKSTTFRLLGKYKEALYDAQAVLALSRETNIDDVLLAEASRETGLAYFLLGDLTKSEKYLNSSIDSYLMNSDDKNLAFAQLDLGVLYINLGKYKEANTQYQYALSIFEDLGNENQQSIILNNIGVVAQINGDYFAAKNWFDSAQAKAKSSSNLRMEAFIYASLGDLAMDLNLFEIGGEFYHRAHSVAQIAHEGYLQSYLELCLATYYRKTDKYKKASKRMKFAFDQIVLSSSQEDLGFWYLENGQLSTSMGDLISAKQNLEKALTIFMEIQHPIGLAKTYLALGITAIISSKSKTDHGHLSTALSTLRQLGPIHPLLPDIYLYKDLIIPYLISSNESNNLKEFQLEFEDYEKNLRDLQQSIFTSQVSEKRTADILEIKAFGHSSVSWRRERISCPEWTQQKTVRELFFYLISKPRGANKEQIGLILWPESSKTQLNCQFKNAVYRLRKAIGKDSIIYNSDTRFYQFNRSVQYSYDVEVFTSIIQKAKFERNLESQIQHYKNAIITYDHPFGNNLEGVWVEPIRESLYKSYEQAVIKVAEYDLNYGNHQVALDICKNLLEIEPTQERCWQLIMCAYSAQDDRSGIIRTYKDCEKIIYSHLGMNPSKSTNDLYISLIQ